MKKTRSFLLTASISLAMAFTFSCSSDDKDDGGGSCAAADNTVTHFCDTRDGHLYKYVTIGTQIWMAENLNYNASGSKCGSEEYVSEYEGKIFYRLKDDNTAYCDKYGRLYNWGTAMNGATSSNANPSGVQGICPSGWHLPSGAEWDVLVNHAGGSSTAGAKLKAKSGWNDNGNGTDDYDFAALPSGVGGYQGDFSNSGTQGSWWTATEYNSSDAYRRSIRNNRSSIDIVDDIVYKARYLLSIRCVKD